MKKLLITLLQASSPVLASPPFTPEQQVRIRDVSPHRIGEQMVSGAIPYPQWQAQLERVK